MQRWLMFMPTKPKRPCKHPGCPRLTSGRYCELHAKLHINDSENAFEHGENHKGDADTNWSV